MTGFAARLQGRPLEPAAVDGVAASRAERATAVELGEIGRLAFDRIESGPAARVGGPRSTQHGQGGMSRSADVQYGLRSPPPQPARVHNHVPAVAPRPL